jgi:hypothetical protein
VRNVLQVNFPDSSLLQKDGKKDPWYSGNEVLYNMCSAYFTHDNEQEIIAKVWLIGRAYSVALERRQKGDNTINDDFYIRDITRVFKNSRIDQWLFNLAKIQEITVGSLPSILEAHHDLVSILEPITKYENRSFASKYLHFHLPHLFFIYDSRASSALRQFVNRIPEDLKLVAKADATEPEYARFFCKIFALQNAIKREFDIQLSPRELDTLLVEIANNRLRQAK